MLPPLTLVQAAKDLDVRYPDMPQDWGICNADATRLSTFVTYFVRHAPTFADWGLEFYLGELLLESANDALRDSIGEYHEVEAAVRAVLSRQATHPTQLLLAYWLHLDDLHEDDDDDEGKRHERNAWYPVASLLRQVQANMAESVSGSFRPSSGSAATTQYNGDGAE
ncbi:hypothetical protein MF271_16705 [Deinococcus sp. KNUC1210]|uniref:hypothetical protein n=1 Tax=Deinococcus sp. KNUC1210 TaxID=2917691 RepID=UPI001EF08AB1|nr:hypothetical protein [Deinococcus sp. KNUC1210]ULH15529.1 hypothetical protein MF271_16705 [Deinococcus sp. KNUC1210]